MLKEDIIPTDSDHAIFWFAPVISTFTGLTAFSVLPFTATIHVADVNVGLLVISAMSAVGILGIILGGWASNSHYPLLGALRSSAQLVSYEVALAFALVSGVMAAGTLSMVGIVNAQASRGIWFMFDNYGFMIVPFAIYIIAATAETNRAPFDLPEAESELVAGFHTEYSGFRWALYFLAEYANIFVVSAVAVTIFWGGWLRPFPSIKWLDIPLNMIFPVVLFAGSGLTTFPLVKKLKDPIQQKVLVGVALLLLLIAALFAVPMINAAVIGLFWFLFKISLIIYLMIWFRGTFPRFRYDQLMNIGWKIAIPVGMAAVFINAIIGMLKQPA
jgi:NADH-quinone oxidoreductase subunit H